MRCWRPTHFEHLERLPLLHDVRNAQHTHDECDILKYRHAGNEAEILKDETDGAAVTLNLRRAECREIAAVHLQLALGRQLFAKEHPQKRGLAGAAGARQKNELAFVDGEGQFAQRVNAAAVLLGEVIGLYHSRRFGE